jgi:ribosomal protein L16 Arg81 hydroxylase
MDIINISKFESGDFGNIPCFIQHNFQLDNITWDSLLIEVKDAQIGSAGNVQSLGNDGYAVWTVANPYINELQNQIQKWKPDIRCRLHLFLSLSDTSQSFDLHRDVGRDNFILHLFGETPWRVANNKFIAKPGDMFFIPNGVPHQAKPSMPRAGLGICFEDPTVIIK